MNKTFVVGDLHGCYDEFIALSNQIGIADSDLLIALGDIVDRGNKSQELYHYFKNRDNSVVLMGNHERKHQRGILSYSQEIVKVQFAEQYEEFKAWTNTLPYYYETEDAIIIHAFFEHDKTLGAQKEEVLAGTTSGSRLLEAKYGTGKYWSDYYDGKKPIIYGHHVTGDKPKIKNNTYGIDTGACHAGYLTIIELPGFIIHQIKVETDYWKEEQAKWQIPVLKAKNWDTMKIEHVQGQLEKLSYKEEPEIREVLKMIEIWIEKVVNCYELIKDKIEEITLELQTILKGDFKREVSKHKYRSFIYKANSNNLQIKDLKKHFDTPKKVVQIAKDLDMTDIPELHL